MSLPTVSVPRRWPEENAGRSESRMLPPTGLGTEPTIGHRKQAANTSTRTPAGSATRSERTHAGRPAAGSAAAAGMAMADSTGAVSGS